MKCKIPEISWHNRDPVLSVDIQPKTGNETSSTIYRLASGGTDAHVLIWYMNLDEHDIALDLAADLTRHQRAVNAVKWSPNGELLASGDDESVVFIWKQKGENEPLNIVDSTNEQDKEVWITMKVLRGHMEDIYDLCWAPNSQFLVSGSVDNSAMIWDVYKGKYTAMLTDHKGFVQGVTWDPKNQYIATLSTDRYLRIFDIQTKRVVHRINKSVLPVPEGHELSGHRMRLFHDDTLQTFFRRLCFTPDGNLLLTPAGVTDYDGATKPLHTTYVFSRYALKQPAIVLPCSDQYTVAVSCCPLLFRLRAHNADRNPPAVPLPYRMIFAVATRSSVYFYDTQQRQPFGLISNIHYTRLTDLTWSSDGRIVVVSSTDGFCSLITFEDGELGDIYEDSAAVLGAAINIDMTVTSKKSKNKQKENDVQGTPTSTQNKSRKASTDDTPTITASRTPLLENVVEERVEKAKDKDEKNTSARNAPTPIAIRRKNENNEKITGATVAKTNCTDEVRTHPTPIAIQSKTDEETASAMKETAEHTENAPVETKMTEASKLSVPPTLPLPVDIIIDKEILSTDEKFESPEKKSRPVTPISVRRQPRTPSSATNTGTPINSSKLTASNQSPLSHKVLAVNSPQQHTKRATPIAVRRAPRALIPPKSQPSPVNAPAVVEEAMDAWPLDVEMADVSKTTSVGENSKKDEQIPEVSAPAAAMNPPQSNIETTCDKTEDMRLVYEDTNEECLSARSSNSTAKSMPVPENIQPANVTPALTADAANELGKDAMDSPNTKQQTPGNNKTPRRVPLRTISTPKSKKKLLD